MPTHAYKFVNHADIPDVPPQTDDTLLLEKAFGDEPLTRQEKDRIAHLLYGTFSSHTSTYRLAGWAWRMSDAKQVHRILVNFRGDNHFLPYYVPDKTSLRGCMSGIVEMIDAPVVRVDGNSLGGQ